MSINNQFLNECLFNGYISLNDVELCNDFYENHVYESVHILTMFDDAVNDIFSDLEEIWNDALNYRSSLNNPLLTGKKKYTGWNLFPMSDSFDEPYVEQAKDVRCGYPIYIRFFDDLNYDADYAVTKYRVMKEDEIKDNLLVEYYKDKILISFNIELIVRNYQDDSYRAILVSTIAHEMLHVYDMYIFKDKNMLDDKKNSILKDFHKNELGLLKNDYDFVRNIVYMISRPEIRSRLKEYQMFLDVFVETESRLNRLKSNIRNIIENGYLSDIEQNEIDEKIHRMFVMCVLMDLKVSDIVQLKTYYQTVHILFNDITGLDNKKYLLVLGYYMYNHDYFQINTKVRKDYNVDNSQLKKFFSLLNIKNYIDNGEVLYNKEKFNDMLFLIKFQLDSDYLRYLNLIYNETDEYFEYLFSQFYNNIRQLILRKSHREIDLYDLPRLKRRKRENIDFDLLFSKFPNTDYFYEDCNIIDYHALYENKIVKMRNVLKIM